MKFGVLLGSFVAVIAIQIVSGKMCAYRKTCLTELEYDESVLSDAYGYRNKIKEGDAKINNYWACCFEKLGYISEDGQFNRARMQKDMYRDYLMLVAAVKPEYEGEGATDSFTNGLLDGCNHIDRSDMGDFAVKMKNCIIDGFWNSQSSVKN